MFISKVHLIEVFFTKLVLNLKSEAAKTYLSYVWWLLEPVLLVLVFYVVFAIFLNRGVANFIIFLMTGKMVFLWFSKSVTNASNSIIAGRGIINQVAIPKPFFPLLVVFQDGVKQSLVFAFMLVFFFLYGMQPDWIWLTAIFIIATQFLLIMGVSLFVAAIIPFLPDFRYLISTGMMALMMGSGIFYSYKDVLKPEHQKLFLLNPLANLIKNYRQVFMDNLQPDWSALLNIAAFSLLLILVMVIYFKKNDTLYARLVEQ